MQRNEGRFIVRHVTRNDRNAWIELRVALWPDDRAAHADETDSFFQHDTLADMPHAVIVAESTVDEAARAPQSRTDQSINADRKLIGLIEVSLPEQSAPSLTGRTAHVEGWYVAPNARLGGVGRALMASAASWAGQHGCRYLTSDTSAAYASLSVPAHLACGFAIDIAAIPPHAYDPNAAGLVGFYMQL